MSKKIPTQRVSFAALNQKHLGGDIQSNVPFQVFKNTLQDLIVKFNDFTDQAIDVDKVLNNSLIDFSGKYDEKFIEENTFALLGTVVPKSIELIADSEIDFFNKGEIKFSGSNYSKQLTDLNKVIIPIVKFKHITPFIKGMVMFKLSINEGKEGNSNKINNKSYFIEIEAINDIYKYPEGFDYNLDGDLTPEFIINIYPQFVDRNTSIIQALNTISLYLDEEKIDEYGSIINDGSDFVELLSDDIAFILTSSNKGTSICSDGEKKSPNYLLSIVRPARSVNNVSIDIEMIYSYEYQDLEDGLEDGRSIKMEFLGNEDLNTTIKDIKELNNKEVKLTYNTEPPIINGTCGNDENIIIPQEYSFFSFSEKTNDEIYKLASKKLLNDNESISVEKNRPIIALAYNNVSTMMLSDIRDVNNHDAIQFCRHYLVNGLTGRGKRRTQKQFRNRRYFRRN